MKKKLLGRMWLIGNTIFILGILMLCQYLFQNKDANDTYKINEVIESIDEEVEVEVLDETTQVTANYILNEYTNALLYRMVDGCDVFPEYLTPSKVIVDAYDTIIICYREADKFQEQYNMLLNDSNTLFAEEIALDDIVLEDISVKNYSKPLSYSSGMINSRAKANELMKKGIDRKITIGIADTGMYSANSVVAKYVDIENSYDYVNNDSCVMDNSDTHATTVVSSLLDVLGEDIATNNVRIINGKCLENGRGSSYTLYLAICGLADKGCNIINMSLGGDSYSEIEKFAIDYATKKGCVLIASAGNDSSDMVSYPAAFDKVIGVTSINKDKQLSGFSNFGRNVDICAPGEDIVVDGINYTQCIASGTSFASPIISGVVALSMLEDNSINTKEEAMSYMKKISEDLGSKGWDEKFGYGLPVLVVEEEPTQETTTEEETSYPESSTTDEEETVPEETTSRKEEPTTSRKEEPKETTSKKEEPTTSRKEEPEETTSKRQEPTTSRREEPTTEEETTKPIETTKPNPQPSKKLAIVESAYHAGTSYGNDYCSRYSFHNVPNAIYYEVFKCDYHGEALGKIDSLNWKKIGTTKSTVYYDYDISSDRVFLVKIRAVDSEGNYGEFSKPFEVNNYCYSPAISVSNIFSDKVTVYWSAYESYSHTGYTIYLYEGDERYPSEIIPVASNKLSYQVNGLKARTKYRVLVLANKNKISYGESVEMMGSSANTVEFITG